MTKFFDPLLETVERLNFNFETNTNQTNTNFGETNGVLSLVKNLNKNDEKTMQKIQGST